MTDECTLAAAGKQGTPALALEFEELRKLLGAGRFELATLRAM
jgi:hypothetical protein